MVVGVVVPVGVVKSKIRFLFISVYRYLYYLTFSYHLYPSIFISVFVLFIIVKYASLLHY